MKYDHTEKAVTLFTQGCNCAQAIFVAFCDVTGMDEELAKRLSSSFGGGMGRMRLVCGAASGMFMLAGLQNGSSTPHDSEGKMANYAFVQQLAGEFKNQYGSLICAELLGLAPKPEEPKPAERTPQYYEKRPCSEMIAQAVRIYLRSL